MIAMTFPTSPLTTQKYAANEAKVRSKRGTLKRYKKQRKLLIMKFYQEMFLNYEVFIVSLQNDMSGCQHGHETTNQ